MKISEERLKKIKTLIARENGKKSGEARKRKFYSPFLEDGTANPHYDPKYYDKIRRGIKVNTSN